MIAIVDTIVVLGEIAIFVIILSLWSLINDNGRMFVCKN